MKDLGEGINGPPLLDPCQGRAGLLAVPCLGRASGPRWQPRHGHEAGRAGPDLGRAF